MGMLNWMVVVGAVAGLLALTWLGYMSWQRAAARRAMRRRIAAARVRSGHVPLEIPTVRGRLGDDPDTEPAALGGDTVAVDEQPCIRIRFLDVHGREREHVVQVETLDLKRKVIVARGETPEHPQIYPLQRIRQARLADSDRPFNLGTWVDAVRVARRRRDAQEQVGEPLCI